MRRPGSSRRLPAQKAGPYQRILVPVDGSRTSMKGLAEAIKLAQAAGATLHLVHIVDTLSAARDSSFTFNASGLLNVLNEQGKKALADAEAAAERAGVPAKTLLTDITSGRVADGIVRAARKVRADLIVIGTHGRRGISHLMLGSDAERVARASPVPVLLVRGPRSAKTRPVSSR